MTSAEPSASHVAGFGLVWPFTEKARRQQRLRYYKIINFLFLFLLQQEGHDLLADPTPQHQKNCQQEDIPALEQRQSHRCPHGGPS